MRSNSSSATFPGDASMQEGGIVKRIFLLAD
jgi:hypothetical protein